MGSFPWTFLPRIIISFKKVATYVHFTLLSLTVLLHYGYQLGIIHVIEHLFSLYASLIFIVSESKSTDSATDKR